MKSPASISIPASEKLGLISNLSTMVNAGLTMAEAVDSLMSDATGNVKLLLTGVHDDITQGKPLYTAFKKYPRIFDTVTVTIIKAAEESGTIDVVLKDIKETVKKDIEFNDKIKSALAYPMIIFVVFLGVLGLLVTFVIPKIASVFLRLRVELPLPTRMLIALSDLVLHYTVPTVVVTVGVIASLVLLYKKQRPVFVRIFLGIPYISSMARQIDLTRFCRSMYLLLNSAIPLVTALELTQSVAVKPEVKQAIMQAREYVSMGKKMTEGLRQHTSVPSLMIKIIEVGERSGTLDKSMGDLAEHFDYQVTTSLQYAVTLLEPVILIFVGVIVGGMMMAVIAPIYNLIGQVGSYH